MRKYETMFILNNNLDEETRKTTLAGVLNVLTTNGAKIVETAEWGKRELAYEINKERYGYYVVTKFECDENKALEEFDRLTRINTNVLRYLVVRLDK